MAPNNLRPTQGWPEKLWRIFGDGPSGTSPGAYIPEQRALRIKQLGDSQFGEFLAVERTPIIELNSSYGTSQLRDAVTTENGATETLAPTGEIQLQTGTNPDGRVIVESAEIGRYIPGFSAEIGLGLRVSDAPTGTQEIRWGGLSPDGNDGLYFLYDADGLAVVRLNNGTESITRQADWNIDTLDGTGKSKVNLDPSVGKIYQIEFTWYGYGAIVFGIVDTVAGDQDFIRAHRLEAFSDTSIRSPNLRVFVEVKNGGTTTTNLDVRLGGRQYAIVGKYEPRFRFTGDRRAGRSTSTTVLPLISFLRKDAFNDRSVKLESYSLLNNGNEDAYIEIRLGGTLTGASFGTPSNYTATETALESDTSATAITGGDVVWAGDIVGAGQNRAPSLAQNKVELDIPNGSVVTLCAATFTGTTTVVSGFRMREEW